MNYLYLMASGVSAFAVVINVMLGRRRLLPNSAPEAERALQADAWFGRHAMSVCLAVMAIAYSSAARRADASDVVTVVSGLALGLASLKVVMALHSRTPRLDVQDWGLPAAAAALALLGVWASG